MVKLHSKQQALALTKRATDKQAMRQLAEARRRLETAARASFEADEPKDNSVRQGLDKMAS